MSTWLINDSSPESLGLTIVRGEFRGGGPSSVTLRAVQPVDSGQVFSYGETVTLTRDGVVFFTGTVRSVPKAASSSDESHAYTIQDAWALLEKTTYQEPWCVTAAVGTTPAVFILLPVAILGMTHAGVAIDMGAQIGEVITFAGKLVADGGAGIAIRCGSMPTGMPLWPTKVVGKTCAEVIRMSLQSHPDWIPWIDHTTTPPTFNVTARATATAQTVGLGAASSVAITNTAERVPDSVRIVYLTATQSGDDIVRDGSIDQYPSGDASGPGVLTTVVPLAGTQAQYQKQQIQTRTLPTDQASAKVWLNLKFPFLDGVDDSHYTITQWDKTVVAETETLPPPVNPNATRIVGTTTTNLPRELVKGSVQDWMRLKVGKIAIQFAYFPTTSATDDEINLLASLPTTPVVVNVTNATTKIYQGLSNWTAPADVPTGIAEAYYNTLANGCNYEGSVTLIEDDIGTTQWHGATLNVTGGADDWTTMGAPIHRVAWDLENCQTEISFGPNKDYSVPDFLEYLKLLAHRTPYWMSGTERQSEKLGDTAGPSSQGDTVGAFDTPETITAPNKEGIASGPWCGVRYGESGVKIKNAVLLANPTASTPETIGGVGTAVDLSSGTKVWMDIPFGSTWPAIDGAGAAIQSDSSWSDAAEFDSSTPPKQTHCRVKIGECKSGKLPPGTRGFNFKPSGGSDLHWEQYLTHNLCLYSCALSGKAAMMAHAVGA